MVEERDKTVSKHIILKMNEELAKDDDTQENMRLMFTSEPASLREFKESQEMRDDGIIKVDGVMLDEGTREPISFDRGERIIKNVEERMLTEANPKMEEMGFHYINRKILRKVD